MTFQLLQLLPLEIQHLISEFNVEHRQKMKQVLTDITRHKMKQVLLDIVVVECRLCDNYFTDLQLSHNMSIKYGRREYYCTECMFDCMYPSIHSTTSGYYANKVIDYCLKYYPTFSQNNDYI